jgi:hypothetical protein
MLEAVDVEVVTLAQPRRPLRSLTLRWQIISNRVLPLEPRLAVLPTGLPLLLMAMLQWTMRSW